MRVDSALLRRLFRDLSKCSVIRPDSYSLNSLFWRHLSREYATQTLAHSTPSPPRDPLDSEPSALYVNPICMQMDQLMHGCSSHEELLNLLVTHRGAMYLHNLVTVMKLLRGFVESEDRGAKRPDCDDLFLGYGSLFPKERGSQKPTTDLTGFTNSEREVITKAQRDLVSHFQDPRNQEYLGVHSHSRDLRDAIIRDERYDLLLQDLYVNKNKLDLVSICNVIMTLDALEHRYYRLYNGLLKRLLTLDMSFEGRPPSFINNVGILLLKTCHCYARSGFYDAPLYKKVSNELFKSSIVGMLTDSEHHELLSHLIKLYAMVKSYDFHTFKTISDNVQRGSLTPVDLSWLAVAFSNHLNLNSTHDRVLYYVADRILETPSDFTLNQLCTCVSAFSRMRLYFPHVWSICTSRLALEVDHCMNGFDELEMGVSGLCKAVHDIATVEGHSLSVNRLLDKAFLYLEDRIDALDEESSINLAISVASTSSDPSNLVQGHIHESDLSTETAPEDTLEEVKSGLLTAGSDDTLNLNSYMLSYVWRRIGTGVAWERQPLKVFAVWLYHMLVLPRFNHNISQRCVLPCFREWLLVYHTRHEIWDECAKIVSNLAAKYDIYTKSEGPEVLKPLLESPVPIDILVMDERFGNKAINVVDLTVRNHPCRPMGVDLVMQRILEHFGLEVHVIDSHRWMGLETYQRVLLVESIILGRE